MSLDYQLLTWFKSELEKIKIANGYSTDLNLVDLTYRDWSTLTGKEMPAAFVSLSDDVLDWHGGGVTSIISIAVDVFVGKGEKVTLVEHLCKLKGDLIKRSKEMIHSFGPYEITLTRIVASKLGTEPPVGVLHLEYLCQPVER